MESEYVCCGEKMGEIRRDAESGVEYRVPAWKKLGNKSDREDAELGVYCAKCGRRESYPKIKL
jgi:hypothetical protein